MKGRGSSNLQAKNTSDVLFFLAMLKGEINNGGVGKKKKKKRSTGDVVGQPIKKRATIFSKMRNRGGHIPNTKLQDFLGGGFLKEGGSNERISWCNEKGAAY